MKAVSGGRLSQREAEKVFGVPHATIARHVNTHNLKAVGQPPSLPEEIQVLLAAIIETMADWSHPMSVLQVRNLVKNMLDDVNVNVPRFIDTGTGNQPGETWVKKFRERRRMTKRPATNISKARHAINRTVINEYFNNLEKSMVKIFRSIEKIQPSIR